MLSKMLDFFSKNELAKAPKNEIFKDLANSLPEYIAKVRIDNELTMIFANKKFLEFLGYNYDNYISEEQSLPNFISPKDIEKVVLDFKSALKNNEEVITSCNAIKRSEEIVSITIKGSFLCYENDYATFFITVHDMTFFKNQEIRYNIDKKVHLNLLSMYDGFTFEYDYTNDTIYFSDSVKKHFNCDTIIKDFNKVISAQNSTSCLNIINTGILNPLLFKVNNVIRSKVQVKANDGEYHWYNLNVFPVFCFNNVDSVVGIVTLLNEKEFEETQKIHENNKIDPLTNLIAKPESERLISEEIKNNINMNVAYLLFDIDGFQEINKNFGEDAGDDILIDFSNHLKDNFRSSDIVGRLDGDVFCVLMKKITDIDLLNEKIEHVLFDIGRILLPDNQTKLSCSIGGIYFKTGTIEEYSDMLNEATQNLNKAKLSGKNCFTITEIR